MLFRFKLFFFLFFGSILFCVGQNVEKVPLKLKSTNVLFLEMGGSGFLYSANYERLIPLNERFKFSGRIGFSYFKRDFIVFGAIPVTTSLLIKDKKDKFNLNIGLGLYCSTFPYYNYFTPTGLVGLRYNFQNGETRNYLQISYTPFLSKKSYFTNSQSIVKWGIYQWFGLSLAQEF